MGNPFTLVFGKKPIQYISRTAQTHMIVEHFQSEESSNQIYMITGVRGSGKTVMMTNISQILKNDDTWIVVELNPNRDLLQSLAAKLNSIRELNTLFMKAKFDFSALGFGVSIEQAVPISDIESAISLMLGEIKKSGKKLLITIDEVTNCEYMKVFVSAFQIFVREEYPIYLLMTGLYENIHQLQNDKSLTFLYRAPKIVLEPLNFTAIKKCYLDIFKIDSAKAEDMAALTKGYPFAFQVLGYLCWEKRNNLELEQIIPDYDQYLDEYAYSKIWSELSALDKKIIIEMSVSKETKVKNIREKLQMKSELFAVYRERLKRKGLVDTSQYGSMTLILPRFDEFAKARMYYENML